MDTFYEVCDSVGLRDCPERQRMSFAVIPHLDKYGPYRAYFTYDHYLECRVGDAVKSADVLTEQANHEWNDALERFKGSMWESHFTFGTFLYQRFLDLHLHVPHGEGWNTPIPEITWT